MFLKESLRDSQESTITFANRLDPNQAGQNIGPDLDPNYLTLIVLLKEFFEKVDFEKESADNKKKHENVKLPNRQRDKT